MADENEESYKLMVDKTYFLEAECAHVSDDPSQQLVLVTVSRIDRANFKVSREEVEASKRGENIEAPLVSDQFVFDDSDSLRLMRALIELRAAQGCQVAAVAYAAICQEE